MKRRLLLSIGFVVVAVSGWSLWVHACDKNQRDASAASIGADRSAGKTASRTSATAAGYQFTAGGASCCSKGAKGANTTAAMTTECSQGLAFAGVLAMPAGGPSCQHDARKSGRTAQSMHIDCDACADMANCSDQLKSQGTQTQVVPLKNGVMFVYTAVTPGAVRAVQAAMVRRTEKLNAITASGDRANLCPDCRTMRGAMASGKMHRETVNIEGGCLTLFTSSDPVMVSKLRAMATAQSNRMKS